MVSHRVEGPTRCAGALMRSLSWVNPARRGQQEPRVSYVAPPGTHAFGHSPKVTKGALLASLFGVAATALQFRVRSPCQIGEVSASHARTPCRSLQRRRHPPALGIRAEEDESALLNPLSESARKPPRLPTSPPFAYVEARRLRPLGADGLQVPSADQVRRTATPWHRELGVHMPAVSGRRTEGPLSRPAAAFCPG